VARVFVGVGSNIDPARNVARAVRRLAECCVLGGISTVYRTPPEGRPGQPWYFNCVVALETALPPADFRRDVLRGIERELGRVRTEDKYAARPIDLDLLLYGDLVVEGDELTLPDPHILLRPFLAHGLHELAPELKLPGAGQSIAAVAAALSGKDMEPLQSFTGRLRRSCGGGPRTP
jgi:2-amino-4-hydroxy-6-hydroxymethyldihydropteridine diphosphokinase